MSYQLISYRTELCPPFLGERLREMRSEIYGSFGTIYNFVRED
jgi:hypothetical protein